MACWWAGVGTKSQFFFHLKIWSICGSVYIFHFAKLSLSCKYMKQAGTNHWQAADKSRPLSAAFLNSSCCKLLNIIFINYLKMPSLKMIPLQRCFFWPLWPNFHLISPLVLGWGTSWTVTSKLRCTVFIQAASSSWNLSWIHSNISVIFHGKSISFRRYGIFRRTLLMALYFPPYLMAQPQASLLAGLSRSQGVDNIALLELLNIWSYIEAMFACDSCFV